MADARVGQRDWGTPNCQRVAAKILITDPVVQVLKEEAETIDNAKLAADPEHKPLAAGWIADRVVKVIRRSPSAGKTVAYRLIAEGN